jgi:hypothetical protein
MLAEIVERSFDLALDLIMDHRRDVHLPGVAQAFEASGHVHAVAVDVILIHDDVAEIDTDVQFDPVTLWHFLVAPGKATLDLGRALGRVHRTRELDQHAITSGLDDATVVIGDAGDRIPPSGVS